jgi:D-alanyl-D-alanine dipeptidase
MLCRASAALPSDVRLGVVEGWRAPHIQRRMYLAVWQRFQALHPNWSDVTLRRVVNRYTAPLNLRVPPPHSTGGAVDLVLLAPDGSILDHTSPYDLFDSHCWSFDAPNLSDTARRTRDTLAQALLSAGLTNYPSEYWHWSYGDQGWAYRGGHPNALYSAITPSDYCPDPAEDIDAPLEPVKDE